MWRQANYVTSLLITLLSTSSHGVLQEGEVEGVGGRVVMTKSTHSQLSTTFRKI